MADIELVVKIPEEMYKWVNDVNKFSDDWGISDFIDLVKSGTPLPKGHGRLIDANKFLKDNEAYTGWILNSRICGDNDTLEDLVNEADTIIEADREQGEKMEEEKPYIVETITMQKKKYNPNYGDNRMCVCGHPYYRHFDTWDDMEAVGCKYCRCEEFIEADREVQ